MTLKKLTLLVSLTLFAFSCAPRDVRISTALSDQEIFDQLKDGRSIEVSQGMLPTCDSSRSAYTYLSVADKDSLHEILSGAVYRVAELGARQCFRIGDAVSLSLSQGGQFGEVHIDRITLVLFDHLSEKHARGTGMSLVELKASLLATYGGRVNNTPIALIDISYLDGSYQNLDLGSVLN